ncbi:Putative NIN-like transcription factor [Ectocarpus siliculosus]|uniref:NIN-like transcription factor n=1 Tax=Ectocarpus siliculosus TaxID=2880 RepID=D7FN15_ECTSI|nr:Putative NIN-like transcription factor [Ectocarpus siliculosus]|eukprot:CBJ30079.1 Putative NIN-like transcription factor [Ectocarpus siliculosus]
MPKDKHRRSCSKKSGRSSSKNSNNGTEDSRGPAVRRLRIPDEPPTLPPRDVSKAGSKREVLADIAKRIPVELMREYFNYPLRVSAEAMHISVTTLKRLCRRHGVKRWPHRQISGLNRTLGDLEAQHDAARGEEEIAAVEEELRQLHRRREVIIERAFESDDESTRNKDGAHLSPGVRRKRSGDRGDRGGGGGDSVSSSSEDEGEEEEEEGKGRGGRSSSSGSSGSRSGSSGGPSCSEGGSGGSSASSGPRTC